MINKQSYKLVNEGDLYILLMSIFTAVDLETKHIEWIMYLVQAYMHEGNLENLNKKLLNNEKIILEKAVKKEVLSRYRKNKQFFDSLNI